MQGLRRLVREVHRRSLWQVLLIYATGSWVVYQVALDLAEGLGLPEWVAPTALILLMAGLPVVLATAFIQEGPPAASGAAGPRASGSDLADLGAPTSPATAAADTPTRRTEPVDPGSRVAGALTPTSQPAPSAARHFTWRNAALGGVAAFALLGVAVALYMGSRVLGVGPAATLLAQGALDENAGILLADVGGSPADSAIAEMVTEALRVDLEQSTAVRLVEPRLLRDAMRRMQRDSTEALRTDLALELALREGIPAVLAGELHRAGGSTVISARLLSPEGEEALASFRQTAADSTAIVAAVDRLSADIRAKIGESLSSIRASPPLERVTARSLPALQRYTTAVRLLRAEPESRQAAALLEEAVAIDSTFAMAWLQLGRLYSFYDDYLESDRYQRAIALARAHADRLSPRERLLAEAWYQDEIRSDQEARYVAVQRLLAEHPQDVEGLNELVEYLMEQKEFGAAREALDRLLSVDSAWALAADDDWLLTGLMGDAEGARAALERYAERFPADSLYVMNQRGFLAAERGDYERADSLWRRLASVGDHNIYEAGAYFNRSWLERARGRLSRYLELQAEGDRILGLSDAVGRFDVAVAALGARAWLGLPAADELEAVRRGLAAGVLDEVPPSVLMDLRVAAVLAIAGQPAEGARVLDGWLAAANDSAEASARWQIANARGEVALATGRLDDALDAFREMRRAAYPPTAGLVDIGRVHLAAGRPDSAIAVWEQYLRTPDPYRLRLDASGRPLALESLGELYEEAGRLDDARAAWSEFAELWSDADAELQPRVEAGRRRVQALIDRTG